MTAFYVAGAITVAWALIVSALGIMRHDFPRSRLATRATMAISTLLVVASVVTAAVTAAAEDEGETGVETESGIE